MAGVAYSEENIVDEVDLRVLFCHILQDFSDPTRRRRLPERRPHPALRVQLSLLPLLRQPGKPLGDIDQQMLKYSGSDCLERQGPQCKPQRPRYSNRARTPQVGANRYTWGG